MILDIFKFCCLYLLVLFAFSCGNIILYIDLSFSSNLNGRRYWTICLYLWLECFASVEHIVFCFEIQFPRSRFSTFIENVAGVAILQMARNLMKCILAFSPRWHAGPYLSCPASFLFGQFCSKFNIRKTLQARLTISLQANRPVWHSQNFTLLMLFYGCVKRIAQWWLAGSAEIVQKNRLSSAQSCLIMSGQKLPLWLAVPRPFYRYYGLAVVWLSMTPWFVGSGMKKCLWFVFFSLKYLEYYGFG